MSHMMTFTLCDSQSKLEFETSDQLFCVLSCCAMFLILLLSPQALLSIEGVLIANQLDSRIIGQRNKLFL